MTALEAIRAVNNRMTQIGLRDRDGNLIVGIECVGIVCPVAPMEWSHSEELFGEGAITPDQYAERLMGLIERFEQKRSERLIRKKIADVALDQVELGLSQENQFR